MKRYLLINLFLFIAVIATAQKTQTMENSKEDSIAISKVLDNYFKGINEGDSSLLSTVFNPGTLLFGDVKGAPYAKTLAQYLDGVQNRQSPKNSGEPFKGSILSVKAVNSIGVAEVVVKMYDFNYHEFLSFHKIDNRWVIVNKMITDVSE